MKTKFVITAAMLAML
jgi:hypothetical protein